MAFNKYKKLKKQWSYNGAIWGDVDPPEYKQGELIEVNSKDCGYLETMERWIPVPDDYICDESYRKWEKLKRQISYDSGEHWEDFYPLEHKQGNLIEENSIDCGYGITWELVDGYICHLTEDLLTKKVEVPNEYICDNNFNLCYKMQVVYSLDEGKTWLEFNPPIYVPGDIYQSQSTECGYTIYEWRIIENEYVCENGNKYEKLQYMYSEDKGETWLPVEPNEFKRGEIIEEQSLDCKEPEYRWIKIDGYLCDGTTKYERLKKQESIDGETWNDVVPEVIDFGEPIESNSWDCGRIEYGYITDEDGYICDENRPITFERLLWAYTEDGETYLNVVPEQEKPGKLIDAFSEKCGYVVPEIGEYDILSVANTDGSALYYADLQPYDSLGNVLDKRMEYLEPYEQFVCQYFDYRYGFKFNYKSPYTSHGIYLSKFNCDSLKYCGKMFQYLNCKIVGLDKLDTSNVVDMSSMFYKSSVLSLNDNKIDTFNTSKVITMNGMFSSIENEKIILKNFTNDVLEKASRMFYSTNLKEADLSGFYTPVLQNLESMFENSKKLKKIDMSVADTTNGTNFFHMFANCVELETLYIDKFNISDNVLSVTDMFYNCNKLTHIRCKQSFKDWCITNQDIIKLPETMREGGSGTWQIVG